MAWEDVPPRVRAALEDAAGGRVASATTQHGGFSPGLAVRVVRDDGQRRFVKAVDREVNAVAARMHRREARIAAALPAAAPAPRFQAAVEVDGWVGLVFEDIDGWMPTWAPGELARVVAALDTLAEATTPCPLPLQAAADAQAGDFTGLRSFADAPQRARELPAWARAALPRLAAIEAGWQDAAAGDTLVHLDVRADNLLLTPDRVVLVDWPWATRGAAWVDVLGLIPSAVMQGAGEPEDILALSRAAQAASPEAIDALVAALTGYFLWNAGLPPPPGIPTVRAFQRAQGEVALAWLGAAWASRPELRERS